PAAPRAADTHPPRGRRRGGAPAVPRRLPAPPMPRAGGRLLRMAPRGTPAAAIPRPPPLPPPDGARRPLGALASAGGAAPADRPRHHLPGDRTSGGDPRSHAGGPPTR